MEELPLPSILEVIASTMLNNRKRKWRALSASLQIDHVNSLMIKNSALAVER
jgi:hypothetical protein